MFLRLRDGLGFRITRYLPCHESHGVAGQNETDCARLGCMCQGVGGTEFKEVEAFC